MLLISGYEGSAGGRGGAEGVQRGMGVVQWVDVATFCIWGKYLCLHSHNYSQYALKPYANFAA